MAFTRHSDIFYHDFKRNNKNWRITLIPQSSNITTSITNEIQFPEGIFTEMLTVAGGYDDAFANIPIASTLEIELDFTNFKTNDVAHTDADWENVADWIMDAGGIVNWLQFGGVQIPIWMGNTWILAENDQDDYSGNWTVHFMGIQDKNNTSEIDLNKSTYKLKLTGLEKFVFDAIPLSDLNMDNFQFTGYTSDEEHNICDLLFKEGTALRRFVWDYTSDQKYRLWYLYKLFENIQEFARTIYRRSLRRFTLEVEIANLDTNWSVKWLYQDWRDGENGRSRSNFDAAGATVPFDKLMFFGDQKEASRPNWNFGFMDPADGGSIYTYGSIYSFLRRYFETFLQKGIFNYTHNSSLPQKPYNFDLTLNCERFINNSSPIDMSTFNYTDIKFETNYRRASTISTYLVDIGSGDTGIYTIDGNLDDDGIELELTFNNSTIGWENGNYPSGYRTTSYAVIGKGSGPQDGSLRMRGTRTLYVDTSGSFLPDYAGRPMYQKPHGDTRMYWGNGSTDYIEATNETSYESVPIDFYSFEAYWRRNLRSILRQERIKDTVYGLHNARNKILKKLFQDTDNYRITLKTNITGNDVIINNLNYGSTFKFDFSDPNWDYLKWKSLKQISGTAYLESFEVDYIKGEAEYVFILFKGL